MNIQKSTWKFSTLLDTKDQTNHLLSIYLMILTTNQIVLMNWTVYVKKSLVNAVFTCILKIMEHMFLLNSKKKKILDNSVNLFNWKKMLEIKCSILTLLISKSNSITQNIPLATRKSLLKVQTGNTLIWADTVTSIKDNSTLEVESML